MMRSHEKWSIHIDLVHKEYANSMFRFPELYYERCKQLHGLRTPRKIFFFKYSKYFGQFGRSAKLVVKFKGIFGSIICSNFVTKRK